jgi:hypothetical protein
VSLEALEGVMRSRSDRAIKTNPLLALAQAKGKTSQPQQQRQQPQRDIPTARALGNFVYGNPLATLVLGRKHSKTPPVRLREVAPATSTAPSPLASQKARIEVLGTTAAKRSPLVAPDSREQPVVVTPVAAGTLLEPTPTRAGGSNRGLQRSSSASGGLGKGPVKGAGQAERVWRTTNPLAAAAAAAGRVPSSPSPESSQLQGRHSPGSPTGSEGDGSAAAGHRTSKQLLRRQSGSFSERNRSRSRSGSPSRAFASQSPAESPTREMYATEGPDPAGVVVSPRARQLLRSPSRGNVGSTGSGTDGPQLRRPAFVSSPSASGSAGAEWSFAVDGDSPISRTAQERQAFNYQRVQHAEGVGGHSIAQAAAAAGQAPHAHGFPGTAQKQSPTGLAADASSARLVHLPSMPRSATATAAALTAALTHGPQAHVQTGTEARSGGPTDNTGAARRRRQAASRTPTAAASGVATNGSDSPLSLARGAPGSAAQITSSSLQAASGSNGSPMMMGPLPVPLERDDSAKSRLAIDMDMLGSLTQPMVAADHPPLPTVDRFSTAAIGQAQYATSAGKVV